MLGCGNWSVVLMNVIVFVLLCLFYRVECVRCIISFWYIYIYIFIYMYIYTYEDSERERERDVVFVYVYVWFVYAYAVLLYVCTMCSDVCLVFKCVYHSVVFVYIMCCVMTWLLEPSPRHVLSRSVNWLRNEALKREPGNVIQFLHRQSV